MVFRYDQLFSPRLQFWTNHMPKRQHVAWRPHYHIITCVKCANSDKLVVCRLAYSLMTRTVTSGQWDRFFYTFSSGMSTLRLLLYTFGSWVRVEQMFSVYVGDVNVFTQSQQRTSYITASSSQSRNAKMLHWTQTTVRCLSSLPTAIKLPEFLPSPWIRI